MMAWIPICMRMVSTTGMLSTRLNFIVPKGGLYSGVIVVLYLQLNGCFYQFNYRYDDTR